MIINDKILGLCDILSVETASAGNKVKALYNIQYNYNGFKINFNRERLNASIDCDYYNYSVEFNGSAVYLKSDEVIILNKLLLALEKQLKKEKEKEEIL